MAINSYTEPLAALCLRVKPKKILEIGMGMEGYSTRVWLEHCDGQLTSIDKQDWSHIAPKFKDEFGERFKFIEGRSEEVMPTLEDKYDLIYIDGLHTYEGAYADIKNAIPLLEPGGLLVVDDYGVHISATDVVDYAIIEGEYGVKQAADELLADWRLMHTDILLGNGGRVYANG